MVKGCVALSYQVVELSNVFGRTLMNRDMVNCDNHHGPVSSDESFVIIQRFFFDSFIPFHF